MGLFDRSGGRAGGKRDWTGWVLVDTEHHELAVDLGQPLGDLEPARLDALRTAFGEKQFNAFSSYDDSIAVGHLSGEDATKIADTLRAAEFRVEMTVRHSYSAHKPDPNTLTYIDDVSREEMERIADEMIAAGVPVTKKRL